MPHRKQLKVVDLRLCSLADQYDVSIELMERANHGNEIAAELAGLSLERYFERLEEGLI